MEAEGAAVKAGEVLAGVALDSDLVVVLEVSADTGEVGDDVDAEFSEFICGTDTAEFQQLRRVVDAAGDDDFTGSGGGAWSARAGGLGARARFVKVFSIQELDAGCPGNLGRVVEDDLCDVAVGADIERVLLAAIVVGGVADGSDEFARAVTGAAVGCHGELIKLRIGIALLLVGIGIASEKRANINDRTGRVVKGKGAASEQTKELGVLQHDADGRRLDSKPAVETMALSTKRQVLIVLHFDEILAHVVGGPGTVTGQGGDVLEIRAMRVNGDQGIVSGASSQCLGARV